MKPENINVPGTECLFGTIKKKIFGVMNIILTKKDSKRENKNVIILDQIRFLSLLELIVGTGFYSFDEIFWLKIRFFVVWKLSGSFQR